MSKHLVIVARITPGRTGLQVGNPLPRSIGLREKEGGGESKRKEYKAQCKFHIDIS